MTAHVHRDHLFQSQMASNGLVPTNMQERLMKEAVMHEQRGAGHHKLQNQILIIFLIEFYEKYRGNLFRFIQ